MTPTRLDCLPAETLHEIVAHLDDTHRRSLFALSAVSQTFQAATASFIFRTLRVEVHNRQQLRQAVGLCLEALTRRYSLGYVRRLEITGYMPPSLADECPKDAKTVTPRAPERNANHRVTTAGREQREAIAMATSYRTDNVFDPMDSADIGSDDADGPYRAPIDEDDAWSPVLELLKALPPTLTHVSFDSENRFPQALLDCMQTLHPQCKLDMKYFRLRSLGDTRRRRWATQRDTNLVTSPNLASLTVRHLADYMPRTVGSHSDANVQAVLHVANSGLAPNLKEVTIQPTRQRAGGRVGQHVRRGTAAGGRPRFRGLAGVRDAGRPGNEESALGYNTDDEAHETIVSGDDGDAATVESTADNENDSDDDSHWGANGEEDDDDDDNSDGDSKEEGSGMMTLKARGQLTHLSFKGLARGNGIATTTLARLDLKAWAGATDFTQLRSLGLDAGVGEEALRWMNVAIPGGSGALFPNLKKLSLRLDRFDAHIMSITTTIVTNLDYTPPAVMFLDGLPPLEDLELAGNLEFQFIETAVARHGPTLRRLAIRPSEWGHAATYERQHELSFKAQGVRLIADNCPLLEDLTIPIRRLLSSALEVDIYRTLGSMKNLERLTLKLDCSNPHVMRLGNEPPDDPSFSKAEKKFFGRGTYRCPRVGHVKHALINSAVDEMLARSIWETICEASDVDPRSRLQSLKLYTTGGYDFGHLSFQCDVEEVMEELSRSWWVRRGGGPSGDDLAVTDLSESSREVRKAQYLFYAGVPYIPHRLPLESYPPNEESILWVFKQLWPFEAATQSWAESWKSFPLQK